ncbi:hypothetical protein [Gracilibacillus sp. JCM 18860]|uniref:hypothetical protein n=1 Tax=Gracilibacillus sp. JCM 18860 TaxID=1306159 RepID=UPI000AEE8C4A
MNPKMNEKVTNIAQFVVLLIFGILLMIPFIWMVSVGFDRTANITLPFPPRLIPEEVASFNYKIVFENGRLVQSYLNSAIVTISSVLLQVFASLLAATPFPRVPLSIKNYFFYLCYVH